MLKIIHTKNRDIFSQLQTEEILLKNSHDSFCLINEGTSPAIVLGICNEAQELVKVGNARKDKIPLIKRFSGGGTVFVDENTIFITFILSKDLIDIALFPESIMRWAETFYKKVFKSLNFSMVENDFVIDNKKIAGNAKYIKKNRFLLHTSFLMTYYIQKIDRYLLLPKKAPTYRKNRPHSDFLIALDSYLTKDLFIKNLKKQLFNSFKIAEVGSNHLKIKAKKTLPITQLL